MVEVKEYIAEIRKKDKSIERVRFAAGSFSLARKKAHLIASASRAHVVKVAPAEDKINE